MVLFFFANPLLLEDIWLWIIGFIGYIVLLVEKGFKAVVSSLKPEPKTLPPPTDAPFSFAHDQLKHKVAELERKLQQEDTERFSTGSAVTVLRYLDDGHSSLGLIFLQKKFFAYTLEDTHRSEKVTGKTRIPSGTYQIALLKQDTPLTESYRRRFPWFTYHLELENVPNFSNIYIHIGNTHVDTDGCILVADGVNSSSPSKMITHSRIAFERLYKKINALLQVNEIVTIRIVDEDWFEQFQLQPL